MSLLYQFLQTATYDFLTLNRMLPAFDPEVDDATWENIKDTFCNPDHLQILSVSS